MKTLLRPAFDFLLFSNIFMALCAVAQGLVTFYLIGSPPVYTVLILLFASTLGLYNFCILIIKPKHPEQSPHWRIRWFFKRYKLMMGLSVVAMLALVPLFFLLSRYSQILLLLLAALSIGYGLPLFTNGNRKSGLRNVPGLKPVLITLVWVLSCVLLPILESRHQYNIMLPVRDIAILIAKRILFIGALTVPFDIRDLFQDQTVGLKTIPVVWGEKNAYLFCQAMLIGYVILLFLFQHHGFTADFWALTITAALTGWLILRSTWERNEYYYFFLLDGVLILQYVALLLFRLI